MTESEQDARSRTRIEAAADTMPETPVRWGRVAVLARRKALLGTLAALALGVVVAVLLVFGGAVGIATLHPEEGSPIPLPIVGVSVPNVIDMTEVQAKETLTDAGLKGVTADICPQPTCVVRYTRPERGSNVLSGAVVKLHLTGPGGSVNDSAASIKLSLSATEIIANGSSTTVATAQVYDRYGHSLALQRVVFSPSDKSVNVGSESEHSPGVYSATITSSKSPETVIVTAKDGLIANTAHLEQISGEEVAASIVPMLVHPEIVANSASQTPVTATVLSEDGKPVRGQVVTFSPSDEGVRVGHVLERAPGVYSATITSSVTAEKVSILVRDEKLTSKVILRQISGAAASIELLPSSHEILANGVSTDAVKAKVFDENKNLVAHQIVLLLSKPGGTVEETTESEYGVYTATITSSKHPGAVTITAKDGEITKSIVITETELEPEEGGSTTG